LLQPQLEQLAFALQQELGFFSQMLVVVLHELPGDGSARVRPTHYPTTSARR
jgi:hypothetical protein